MRIVIIGGGFLGQLLHTLWPTARVFDWRPRAPVALARQYGPQYLWTPVGTLPHREFTVYTSVDGKVPTEESILAYKHKVGKEHDNSDWRAQFVQVMPGYECALPPNRVEYGRRIIHINWDTHRLNMADSRSEPYDALISTVPLDSLLSMCGFKQVEDNRLKSRPIYLATEASPTPTHGNMFVDYVADPGTAVYRRTGRDDQVHVESLHFQAHLPTVKILPGKIYPHPDVEALLVRLRLIDIYCLGRFGTWSPDELAHETYRNAVALKEKLS
jgi:hypothetical protein